MFPISGVHLQYDIQWNFAGREPVTPLTGYPVQPYLSEHVSAYIYISYIRNYVPGRDRKKLHYELTCSTQNPYIS